MKKSELLKKYCIQDAGLGRWQCLLLNGRKHVKYKWFESKNKIEMYRWAKSLGIDWTSASIRDAENNYKTVDNFKNSDTSNPRPMEGRGNVSGSKPNSKNQSGTAKKDEYKKEWTIIVQNPRGGEYPGIKVVLKKKPSEMSPAEIRGLVEKHIHGPWMRGGFVMNGFWQRHFYNKKEKQIPVVGAHPITGIPV